MKYLNKFRSDDELQKNYYGYGSLVTSFVANNTTYNYSRFENGEYYIWEDPNYPNDETHSVTTYGVRNPEVGYMVTSWGGSDYEITSISTQQMTGRDIPYDQPWVSLAVDQTVNYNKYHCNINGYSEYVDLGLPSGTLWATCNLGASTSEATGGYYAWGELATKASYNWDNYRFGDADYVVTKYNDSDYLLELQEEDDVANVTMGGDWHIPYPEDFQELGDYTNVSEETINGVHCYRFTSFSNPDKSIVIPTCGYYDGSTLTDSSNLYYWSNIVNGYDKKYGLYNGYDGWSDKLRSLGLQIRPCIDSNPFNKPYTAGCNPPYPWSTEPIYA